MFLLPRSHGVAIRRELVPQQLDDLVGVAKVLELDLQGRDRARLGPVLVGADHLADLLQMFEVAEDEVRVVLAHPALEDIDDSGVEVRPFGRSGRGRRELHIMSGPDHRDGSHLARFFILVRKTDESRAEVNSTVLRLCVRGAVLGGGVRFAERIGRGSHRPGVARFDRRRIAMLLLLEFLHELNPLAGEFRDALAIFHRGGRQFPTGLLVEAPFGGSNFLPVALSVIALQVIDERPDFRFAFRVDADQRDRVMNVLPAVLEAQHPVHLDGRGDTRHVLPDQAADESLMSLRVRFAVGAPRLDDDVGEHALDALAHLAAEPGHHRVDHDHRGHSQRDTDDAGESDVARPQITLAEKQFVHGPILWLCVVVL